MSRQPREFITCYDSGTSVKIQKIYCPTCKSETEFEYKEPPEIKTIIIECSACSIKSPSKKSSRIKIGY